MMLVISALEETRCGRIRKWQSRLLRGRGEKDGGTEKWKATSELCIEDAGIGRSEGITPHGHFVEGRKEDY